jgi:UDP-N-acetylglucosamine pyrophosphorylase
MASDCTLAKAPDGNGGVYMALRTAGILEKLLNAGVST